jgi:hypothetical protein
MLVRQVVLLIPPESSHLKPLPSRQHFVSISPLSATLIRPSRKCCKHKTYGNTNSFRCNTYKKPGEGAVSFNLKVTPHYIGIPPLAVASSFSYANSALPVDLGASSFSTLLCELCALRALCVKSFLPLQLSTVDCQLQSPTHLIGFPSVHPLKSPHHKTTCTCAPRNEAAR